MPRARESGMEVSEAQLKQMEGRQDMVKSRVAVHAFDVAAVNKTDIRRHGNRARNVPSRSDCTQRA